MTKLQLYFCCDKASHKNPFAIHKRLKTYKSYLSVYINVHATNRRRNLAKHPVKMDKNTVEVYYLWYMYIPQWFYCSYTISTIYHTLTGATYFLLLCKFHIRVDFFKVYGITFIYHRIFQLINPQYMVTHFKRNNSISYACTVFASLASRSTKRTRILLIKSCCLLVDFQMKSLMYAQTSMYHTFFHKNEWHVNNAWLYRHTYVHVYRHMQVMKCD